jgi:UDP-hydrolysing UDP-N-acetyl-D-glucosamine 2-epimerase
MKIHYVSGSRADFGLMRGCLQHLAGSRHELSVVATGQHLLEKYGSSVNDIRAAGLSLAAQIPARLTGESGGEMARAFTAEMDGMIDLWERDRPDLVLVLGDRGEMLAATLAAVHLGIFTAHIHGGERSGTLDESLRHAISKLAHVHFPATEDAAQRLKRMGELPETIRVIGAPGLVDLCRSRAACIDRRAILSEYGLSVDRPLSLVVFHPVVQEAGDGGGQIRTVIRSLQSLGHQLVVLRPNSDAGGKAIDQSLDAVGEHPDIVVLTHLERRHYLSLLAAADVLVGNSSSGIIESASLGTPCVNLGSRQNDRLRNDNTIDCPEIREQEIQNAVSQALALKGPFQNFYGDGRSDEELLSAIDQIEWNPRLLVKRNAF